MSTSYLGIKLGSTTTYIYKPGNGIVLREASMVAMSSNFKFKDVKAVGNDAKRLIGKTDEDTKIYSPIVNGKRIARNVYANSIDECEILLDRLIKDMKAEFGIKWQSI